MSRNVFRLRYRCDRGFGMIRVGSGLLETEKAVQAESHSGTLLASVEPSHESAEPANDAPERR